MEDGVCGVTDIDAAIADGLGLRWSFIGPFETIDLNSPAGVRGYCEMLGSLYHELAREHTVALVPFLLDDVAGIRELNQSDGIHPNAEGASRIAEHLWPAVELLVRRMMDAKG